MGVFINLSNHPHENWGEKQMAEAERYGEVIDLPFPMIDAKADEKEIDSLADQYCHAILEYQPAAVMCQGEFTFSFSLISRLLDRGITVVAACSESIARENNGIKTSEFRFTRFREYRKA